MNINKLKLDSLKLFALVVKHQGFSEASRQSNIAIATISRRVSELEKQMGIRLLERSTRQMRTTREGAILFDFVSRGLEEINAGQLAILDIKDKLQGVLRLSIPKDLNFWWPLLNQFQLEYPNISLDIFTTERRIDLIADGIDVAVRIGDLKTQSAVARKITDYRHYLVASTNYLERHGVPKQPNQLNSFPCGAWSRGQQEAIWNLAGQDYIIEPKVKVNDFAHLLSLALNGDIITELPPLFAKPYLTSGELNLILKDYPLPKQSINLLYPSRKYLSPISRAYIDFALQYCQKEELFE